MASLFQTKKTWIVEVYRRGRIACGRDKSTAREIHKHVEALEQAVKYGMEPSVSTLAWVRRVDDKIRLRLVSLGLVGDTSRTVGDLVDYFSTRKAAKKRTQDVHDYAVKHLEKFFGREVPLSDIKKPDCIRFKQWMLDKGRLVKSKKHGTKLSKATVSRRFKHLRGLFEAAIELEWISKNPFKNIKAGKQTNPGRKQYVTPGMAQRILDDLPTVELRLIFALLRWGGMRMPTEPLELKWTGIDWQRKSMTFRVPKSEHIEGHEFRTCPIFHELSSYIDDAYHAAPDKAVWCCPELRKQSNPRLWFENHLEQSLKRLDIPKWPVIFNSLRASRATEIRVRHGVDDEAKWIGHGADVSMLHYVLADADIDNSWERATAKSANQDAKQANRQPAKKEI